MPEIENVPLPEEKKKPSRARKAAKAPAKQNGAAALLKAIEFVGMSQKPIGHKYQTHCILNRNWAVTAGEVLTVGCPIEDEISSCPNTHSLLQALRKCGQHVSIVQLENNTLAIASDKFKAKVPCVELEDLPIPAPDAPFGPITDAIKEAFGALAWVPQEGEVRAACASVLLQSGTCVATDGIVLLECYHGIDLGNTHLMIPKAAAQAIARIDKKLDKLGYSDTSATFWFTDGSFVKTQLFPGQYCKYLHIFDKGSDLKAELIPADFFEGIAAVEGFADGKFVYFCGDRVQSSQHDGTGASYDLAGVPNGISFNAEYLKAIQPHFSNLAFKIEEGEKIVFFAKDNIRGALMGGKW